MEQVEICKLQLIVFFLLFKSGQHEHFMIHGANIFSRKFRNAASKFWFLVQKSLFPTMFKTKFQKHKKNSLSLFAHVRADPRLQRDGIIGVMICACGQQGLLSFLCNSTRSQEMCKISQQSKLIVLISWQKNHIFWYILSQLSRGSLPVINWILRRGFLTESQVYQNWPKHQENIGQNLDFLEAPIK